MSSFGWRWLFSVGILGCGGFAALSEDCGVKVGLVLADTDVGHVVLMHQVIDRQLRQEISRVSLFLGFPLRLLDAATEFVDKRTKQAEDPFKNKAHKENKNADQVDNSVELLETFMVSSKKPIPPMGDNRSVPLQEMALHFFRVVEVENVRVADHVDASKQVQQDAPLHDNLSTIGQMKPIPRGHLVKS